MIKRFEVNDSVKGADFYTDKFALWIDLRTYPDNEIHGSGFELNNTRDGIKLEIKRQKGGSGVITCHMFVVADAVMAVMKCNLKEIVY